SLLTLDPTVWTYKCVPSSMGTYHSNCVVPATGKESTLSTPGSQMEVPAEAEVPLTFSERGPRITTSPSMTPSQTAWCLEKSSVTPLGPFSSSCRVTAPGRQVCPNGKLKVRKWRNVESLWMKMCSESKPFSAPRRQLEFTTRCLPRTITSSSRNPGGTSRAKS